MYHGQAGIAYQRITRDHGQAIVRGCNDSLHYFLLWLGNGHRTANLLRVWKLLEGYGQSRGKGWTDVMMILYESINIRFRPHHGLLHFGSMTRHPALSFSPAFSCRLFECATSDCPKLPDHPASSIVPHRRAQGERSQQSSLRHTFNWQPFCEDWFLMTLRESLL